MEFVTIVTCFESPSSAWILVIVLQRQPPNLAGSAMFSSRTPEMMALQLSQQHGSSGHWARAPVTRCGPLPSTPTSLRNSSSSPKLLIFGFMCPFFFHFADLKINSANWVLLVWKPWSVSGFQIWHRLMAGDTKLPERYHCTPGLWRVSLWPIDKTSGWFFHICECQGKK